jgi:hypothetical protein
LYHLFFPLGEIFILFYQNKADAIFEKTGKVRSSTDYSFDPAYLCQGRTEAKPSSAEQEVRSTSLGQRLALFPYTPPSSLG